jgi:acyl carrier protein
MSREDLRATLATLLEEEMGETYDLADDVDLRDGLGLDSVDVVGLVMRLEREFRIRLAMEDLQGVRTVGSMIDALRAKLDAPPSGETRPA